MSPRILVVDNFDSFVFNLVQYLQQLGCEVDVRRNDEVVPADIHGYDGVLLSPGPGTPESAGPCIDIVDEARSGVPLLGVCLGHQAIAVAEHAVVTRAPELLHGKTSLIHHDGSGVFRGLPNPMRATRYHSLAIDPDTVPDTLIVTARSESGVIMGVRHRDHAIEGVQFHPESVLTEHGHQLLANWLITCGDPDAVSRSEGLSAVAPRG